MSEIEEFFSNTGRLSKMFPGYQKRQQQVTTSIAVMDTMNSRGNLLAEAPVGVGKSLGYLIPSFERALKGDTVIISTHTISLQSQLMEKDIKLVKELYGEEAEDVEVVQMKGRSNYVCDIAMQNSESDLLLSHDPLNKKVQKWYQSSRTGDKAELTFKVNNWEDYTSSSDSCASRKCPSYYNCAYYKNRARARGAKIIIVNHALFFTDLVMRIEAGCVPETFDGEFKREFLLPDYQHVVFDEAHQLEEVATEAFGVSMSSRKIPMLVKKIQKLGITSQESLDNLEHRNSQMFDPLLDNKFDFTLEDSEDLKYRSTLLKGAVNMVSANLYRWWEFLHDRDHDDPEAAKIKPLLNSLDRSRDDIHEILQCDTSVYVRWGHVEHGKWPKVEINKTPISVAPQLKEEMWKPFKDKVSVTMVSATLSADGKTFGYVKNHLGLEQAREVIVDSPFDYKNHCMLYVPKHLAEPEKSPTDLHVASLTAEISELIYLIKGGAFCLFTSRTMLDKVYDAYMETEPAYPTFKQGDMGHQQLLSEFKKSGNGILFGLSSFWTGVDVQGDALRAVIIDRIPFAVPDGPVQKAKLAHITNRGGNAFIEYSVPQAMITLRQGTGRLIRTVTDKGIVAIMDSRLHTKKSYGPRIMRALPESKKATTFDKVEEWWRSIC